MKVQQQFKLICDFFSTEELKKCSSEIQIQYNLLWYVTSQINKAYLLDIFITETHVQKMPTYQAADDIKVECCWKAS